MVAFRRILLFLMVTLVWILALAGAITALTSAQQTGIVSPTPAVDPATLQIPFGVYSTVITLDDLFHVIQLYSTKPVTADQVLPFSPYSGRWELKFAANGQLLVTHDNTLLAEESYRASNSTLKFTGEDWSLDCNNTNRTLSYDDLGVGGTASESPWVSYKWSIDKEGLKLDNLRESCQLRNVILRTHPLKFTPS